jgi:hypothetical protein
MGVAPVLIHVGDPLWKTLRKKILLMNLTKGRHGGRKFGPLHIAPTLETEYPAEIRSFSGCFPELMKLYRCKTSSCQK